MQPALQWDKNELNWGLDVKLIVILQWVAKHEFPVEYQLRVWSICYSSVDKLKHD